jgi:hypothetical protein
MTTRAVLVVVIIMGVITVCSIIAATVITLADKDAAEVWKLAGTGLLALSGVLVARRGKENGNGHLPPPTPPA